MHRSRPISKNKKISNNITKNVPQKALYLLTTNNLKKHNNINNFFPFSLLKSRSIVPFSSNTSRNQKNSNMKNSFENLLNKQKSLRNSTIKNKSLINSIKPKSKSKSKSKRKRGISTQKPKISNMKNSSYLVNNELMKNIILIRKKNKNKNKNNLIKNKNNKKQNDNYNISLNLSKSRSNSIRCSLNYVNRYSYISKPDNPKLKYDDCVCITSRERNNKINILFEKNKKINKEGKWIDLYNKLENLKIKTNSLLNKYFSLTENLQNELEMFNSNYDNKNYDYKKFLIYDKNYDDKIINDEFLGLRYINTDINNK